ncbi:DUF1428 domain-containing protein [Dongia sp.]|uniref:DUF1428 domain-containing protein n=1 Tax=Dongia sp. TaxID=1977262 RepID=UPI0035B1EACE
MSEETMRYVDGFVLPVARKNLPAYRRLARQAAKIFREHGALEVREYVGDKLDVEFGLPFPKLAKVKRGETVIFSWILFKSRAHRDKVMAKVMADSRMDMDMNKLPFDIKRMAVGGFSLLVGA